MDWLVDDFDFLADSASSRIRQHRAALARCAAGLDRSRGAALRQRIERDLRHHESDLATKQRHFVLQAEDVRRSAAAAVRGINHKLALLEAPISWAAAAVRSDVRLAPVFFAETAARDLLGAVHEVVIVPRAESEYATPIPLAEWANGELPGSERTIVIFVPPSEEASTLLLPLLVHEIGHVAIGHHKLVRRVKQEHAEKWETALDEATHPTGDLSESQARERAAFNLEYWVRELICDVLAAGYCGPSYLYAFAASVLRRELGSPTTTHPPAAERIVAIAHVLDKLGWGDPTFEPRNGRDTWLTHLAHAKVDVPNTAYNRLLQELPSLIRRIAAIILDQFPDVLLTPDRTTARAEAAELLTLGVLPVQLSTGAIADARTILLAAWEQAFGAGAEPRSLPVIIEDVGYQELLERTLELSVVVENWGTRGGGVAHDAARS